MDAPRDPYAELGVPHTAPAAEITNAYHRLVRRFHPDTRSPAASAAAADIALTRIMAAYAILNDPDRRPSLRQSTPAAQPPPAKASAHPFWIGPRPPDIRVTPVHWHQSADPA